MLSQTSVEHKILNVYIDIEYPANYFQWVNEDWDLLKMTKKKKHQKNGLYDFHAENLYVHPRFPEFRSDIRFENESSF